MNGCKGKLRVDSLKFIVMKWFTEKEFWCKCTECQKMKQAGMPADVQQNVRALVSEVLDPVREKLGGPLRVNSGYRCREHNLKVGGVRNSQHMAGEAADITCADNAALEKIIREQGKFDQMIVYPTFVHVSYKRYGQNRHQVLRKVEDGYRRV